MGLRPSPASPDGKLVAGVYEGEGGLPTGVYDVADATWHAIARGCQPYLLPCTNPYRYWLCDGGHRGGRMFTNPTIPGQTIYRHFDLRNAPNMGRTEVRYPHWSNDVHFMAVDSPYPIQTNPTTVNPPQCKKTEICIARFDRDLTKIEKWLQVTDNNVGDYFASMWVDTSNNPFASQPGAPESTPHVAAAASPVVAGTAPQVKQEASEIKKNPVFPPWPSGKTGLVYLWENGSAANEIINESGKHSMCIPDARDAAIFGHYGVMDLAGGSFCAMPETTMTMLDACKKTGSFSIEVVIHPEELAPDQQSGSILSFSSGASNNVALRIAKNDLTLRLHTSQEPDSIINLGAIKGTTPQHLVVTFEKRFVTSYLNGRIAALNGNTQGDLQVWTPAPLVFGDDYGGGHNWPGAMEGIAIYNRALGAQEVAVNYAAYAARIANRQKPAQRVEVSAKLYETTPNSTPDAIRPYHRLLVVDSYEVVTVLKGTCEEKKISVAHWGILNDRVVALDREVGKTYHLVLEPMDDNPQLESECTHNDSTDTALPLYYDVDKHIDKMGPNQPGRATGQHMPE